MQFTKILLLNCVDAKVVSVTSPLFQLQKRICSLDWQRAFLLLLFLTVYLFLLRVPIKMIFHENVHFCVLSNNNICTNTI